MKTTLRISLVEKLILFILILIAPLHAIVINTLNKSDITTVNFYFITSIVIASLFSVMIFIQIIFKRPYITIVLGCHQKCERSFKWVHHYLGICARCTGILIGVIITPLITIIPINKLFYVILITPLIVDGLFQHYTNYESNNVKRIITGIMFGPSMVLMIAYYNFFLAKFMLYLIEAIN